MLKIKKGDNVQIMVGKDKGKNGKVEKVLASEAKVFVTGINLSKRHVKKTGQNEGGIIEIMKPLAVAKVALICPSCKKSTRVGFRIEKDVKTRFCKKCRKDIKN